MYTKDGGYIGVLAYTTLASYVQALKAAEEGDFLTYKKKNKRSFYCSIATIVTGVIVYVVLATAAVTLVLNFLALFFFFVALLSTFNPRPPTPSPEFMNDTQTSFQMF